MIENRTSGGERVEKKPRRPGEGGKKRKQSRIRLDYRAAHHRFRRVVGVLASAVDWLETRSYQSMGISRAIHGSINVGLALELHYYVVLCILWLVAVYSWYMFPGIAIVTVVLR